MPDPFIEEIIFLGRAWRDRGRRLARVRRQDPSRWFGDLCEYAAKSRETETTESPLAAENFYVKPRHS